jgi:DNA-3-methyladenine glycosylase
MVGSASCSTASTGNGCCSVTEGRRSAPISALPPLPRAFYGRPTVDVAHALLGKLLVRHPPGKLGAPRVARIVEVEAYLGERDAASHARRGPTPRAAIMFGPPGFLYVYLIYGMHHCMNVITQRVGEPTGVLLRAGDPGAKGPGVLCRELGVTREQLGIDLTAGGPLRIERGEPAEAVVETRRIGVDYAGDWALKPWRFYIEGNPYVSRPLRRPRQRVTDSSPAGSE